MNIEIAYGDQIAIFELNHFSLFFSYYSGRVSSMYASPFSPYAISCDDQGRGTVFFFCWGERREA